jgi:hypothetical protein
MGMLFACLNIHAQEAIKHAFIVVDNGGNELRYVDQFEPEKSWTVQTDDKPRDLRLSADGKTLLVSVDAGAVEYEVATGKKTGFAITNRKGIQSAQRLKSGNYLLATQEKIFVCTEEGETVKEIPIASGSKPYIRLVTVTDEETLLYTAMKPFCINEVDFDGKVLATVKMPDKGFKVARLKNGNYLTSSGDSVAVFEVTPKGEVVKTYGGKKAHPTLDLTFNSGWQVLADGNVVATCWHGHGYVGAGPHLVEYSADNKAVWSWSHSEVKQVTNVVVLK